MEYRKRKDEIASENKMFFEDNVIGWYDAISNKIGQIREKRFQYHNFYFDNAIIAIAPISNVDSEVLLSGLNQKEWYLPYLEKMQEHRRREWLTVRILLKELFGEEKEIGYHSSGKPFLTDGSYKINISHTKGYVAVIADKEREVAVDIEKTSPRVKKIQSRFMNEEEEKNITPENEITQLLLYWSAKESLFKLINKENVEFRNQLHIQPFEPVFDDWSHFYATETRTELKERYKVHYIVTTDYVLTYIIGKKTIFA